MVQPVKLVYCYARKDEGSLKRLRSQLNPLERRGLIQTWYDRQIVLGTNYNRDIEKHLDEAHLIILLISADFLASSYCYSQEMEYALKREKEGKVRVLPVILSSCLWTDTPLRVLQALPRDGKPVKRWSDKDNAWHNVAEGIREIALIIQAQAKNADLEVIIPQEERVLVRKNPVLPDIQALPIPEQKKETEEKPHMAAERVFSQAKQQSVKVPVGIHALQEQPKPTSEIFAAPLLGDEMTPPLPFHFTLIDQVNCPKEARMVKKHLPWNPNRDAIKRLIWSADEKMLISQSTDGVSRIWDLSTMKELRAFHIRPGYIWYIEEEANTPGSICVYGNGTARFWHLQDIAEKYPLFQRSFGSLTSLALSADGNILAGSRGRNAPIEIWESSKDLVLLHTLSDKTVFGSRLLLSANGQILVHFDNAGKIRVWKLMPDQKPCLFGTYETVKNHPFCAALSADGSRLAYRGIDGMISIHSLLDDTAPCMLYRHPGRLLCLDISADGSLLTSGGTDGSIRFWNLTSRPVDRWLSTQLDEASLLPTGANSVSAVVLSRSRSLLASGDRDGSIKIWQYTK